MHTLVERENKLNNMDTFSVWAPFLKPERNGKKDEEIKY
jgi:hypothetical protein